MKLLTKAQFEKLLANGRRQAAVKGTEAEIDFPPVVKLFNPAGAATWLLSEIDPEDHDIAFGLCDLGMGCPELGSVRLSEIAAMPLVITINGRRTNGVVAGGIERDRFFEADKSLSAYVEAARKAGRIIA